MKNPILFLIFLCLFISNYLSAQNQSIGNPPDWNWVQTIGGNSGADHGQCIVGDAQGNFFIAGDFSGTTQFGNTSLTTEGQVNGFAAKCDSLGTVLWSIQLKSSSVDGKVHVQSLTLDTNGNLLVFGCFLRGDLKLGNQTFPLSFAPQIDRFLAKFAPNGALIWLKTQGTSDSVDLPSGKILADSDGSIFLLTEFNLIKYDVAGNWLWSVNNPAPDIVDIAIKGNSMLITGLFNTAIFIANVDKFNGAFYNGRMLATFTYSTRVKIKGLAMLNETDYFLAGSFKGDLFVGPDTLSSPNSGRYFLAKFVSGNCAWAVASDYTGETLGDPPQAGVAATTAGDAYLFGRKGSLLSFGSNYLGKAEAGFLAKFDGSTGSELWLVEQPAFFDGWTDGQNLFQIGAPFYEVNLRKTNDAGTILWNRNLDSDSGLGCVTSVKTDNSGLYFLTNVSAKNYFLGQPNYDSTGSIVVTKTNHAGNSILWQQTIPGTYSVFNYGHSLWLDKPHEKLYLIGVKGTYPTVSHRLTHLIDTNETKGFFVSQMGTDGSFGWTKTLPINAFINSVITDAAGNIFINGTFTGELHLDNITLTSAGAEDIFWAKLNANGQYLLAERMGGEARDHENYAGIDGQGNFYMSGYYYSVNIDFNGSNQTIRTNSDGLIYYVKFAPDGQVLWVKNFGNKDQPGESYTCEVTNVAVDAAGNSFLMGYHGKSNYFGNLHLTSNFYSYFMAKINPDGDPIWAKSVHTGVNAYGYCEIGLDENGDCYIGGQYRSNDISFDNILITKVGAQDGYFAKLDGTNGTTIWVKTISGGPDASVWPATISVFDHESLFVGGFINDRLNFDAQSINTYSGRKGFLALIGNNIVVSTAQPTAYAFFITVSPNPTAEKVTISNTEDFTGNLLLEIFNASGQLVTQQSLADFSGKTTLDLSASPAGTYFLKASSQSGQQIVRLVKN